VTTAPPADWQAVHSPAHECVVAVDGLRFVVRTTLPVLLEACSSGRLSDILPGCLDVDGQRQWALHLIAHDSPFDLHDANAVAAAVVEDLTGVPAETAVALAAWLTREWLLIDGYHSGRGVDLLTMPPRRLFATLYAFAVEHRFKDRDEADQALFPPPVLRPPTQAEQQRGGNDFLAALAMAGSMPGVGS
jgi:hypothetical protein